MDLSDLVKRIGGVEDKRRAGGNDVAASQKTKTLAS